MITVTTVYYIRTVNIFYSKLKSLSKGIVTLASSTAKNDRDCTWVIATVHLVGTWGLEGPFYMDKLDAD